MLLFCEFALRLCVPEGTRDKSSDVMKWYMGITTDADNVMWIQWHRQFIEIGRKPID